MKKLILLAGLMISLNAQAGLFGSDAPPKDFLGLAVNCVHCSGVNYKVSEYADFGFAKEATRSWEKVDGDQWILEIKNKDKMTGQVAILKFLFAKDGKVASLKRVVVNGDEIDKHTAIRFQIGIYNNVQGARSPAGK